VLEATMQGPCSGSHRQTAIRAQLAPSIDDVDGQPARFSPRHGASRRDTDDCYAGQQVVLLWDGLSAHWSQRMRAHLDAERGWLRVERLAAYAPELNPVEFLWANLKDGELANFAGDNLAEVADQAQQGIQRVCDSDSLVVGFLAHTGLSLDEEPSP
jgi:hypothetical protein